MKFARKPKIVEAVQWLGTDSSEAQLLEELECKVEPTRTGKNGTVSIISPRGGPMEAYIGDWIVKNGKFYDCYTSKSFWATFQTIIDA
jgi:hypothetical protein